MLEQNAFDCDRPYVLPAGDDEIAPSAVDVESPVGQPASEIASVQPAFAVDGSAAVAIGAQQHRAAQQNLGIIGDADVDAVERPTVVDHAAAGLGHPVRGVHVRRERCGRPRAAEHDNTKDGWVQALERSDAAWARQTAATLRQRSPLMLHVALEQIRRARHMNMADELRMERDMVHHCFNPTHLARSAAGG